MSQIPANVIHCHSAILNWEDANNAQELSVLTDPEEFGAMACSLYHAFRFDSPPIIITSTDWRQFVLDVFLDYAQSHLGVNMRSVVKRADELDIIADHASHDVSDPDVESGNDQFMRAIARFNTTIGTD